MTTATRLELEDLQVDTPPLSPPLRRTPMQLPFDQLSPPEFEWLIALLIEQSRSPSVHIYGRSGQKQHGLDIFEETPSGSRIAYQVKRYQTISAKDIADAVSLFATSVEQQTADGQEPLGAETFVLVTSAGIDRDAKTVDAISRLINTYRDRFTLAVWGAEPTLRRNCESILPWLRQPSEAIGQEPFAGRARPKRPEKQRPRETLSAGRT